MFTHTGHVLMTAHFLLSGYLFIWALVGIDPGPARPSYPFRLILLLMTLGFHAFFGISLDGVEHAARPRTGGTPWARPTTPRCWPTSRPAARSPGRPVTSRRCCWRLALLVGWVRSDAQETRRLDRKADRDGDAELRRYNEQLASITRRDGQ